MFNAVKPPNPIEISKFLGINETVGETELKIGEATKQVNYRITQNYKPQKRQGHKTFINYSNTKDVQGLWYGEIAGKEVLISCNDGKVYEYNFLTQTNTQIGTITDAKTSIFYFESKLYFLNGTDYKEYDGTTFQDPVPYIPTIAISLPPSGGEPNFEQINLLTGTKKAEFIADGVSKDFFITETNVDSVGTVTVNGVTKTLTTDYTVNTTLGKVTFVTAPADEAVVFITWTKTVSGHADFVKKNRFAMTFGPGNDTSIFIWGNPDAKNRRMWSASLKANYWPVYNFTLIGTNEFAITDIKPQYDRQIIFKEDRTHYSSPEYIAETQTYDYPVYDLNERVGNVAYNSVQIVDNSPISIKGQSWWKWTSTNIEDERNAIVISERLRVSLSKLDLTKAITFDYQSEKEYWCNVDNIVYIWNYGNNTMYTYDNVQATCFIDIKGTVYYGSNGTIERFEGRNDNGVAITAQLYLAFTDFGVMELKKNTKNIWVSIQPDSQTSCTIYYQTNKTNELTPVNKKVDYRLLDFNHIDFNNFSFLTNRNPQTFNRSLRAKKYTVIRFILENKELEESLLILSLKIEAETLGAV